MTKRIFAIVLAASAFVASSSPYSAAADETPAKAGTGSGTITLKPTTVVGRYTRPSVVIEVTRAKPEVKLPDLADPAVEKIIRAASSNARAPF